MFVFVFSPYFLFYGNFFTIYTICPLIMTVLRLCQLNVFLKSRNVSSGNSCMPITSKHMTKDTSQIHLYLHTVQLQLHHHVFCVCGFQISQASSVCSRSKEASTCQGELLKLHRSVLVSDKFLAI